MTTQSAPTTIELPLTRLRRVEHLLYILRMILAGLAWLGLEAVNLLPGIRVGLDSLDVPYLGVVALSVPPFGLVTTLILMAARRRFGAKNKLEAFIHLAGGAEHSETKDIVERSRALQAALAEAKDRLRAAEAELERLPEPGFWASLFGTKTATDHDEAQAAVKARKRDLEDLERHAGHNSRAHVHMLSRHNRAHLTWMGYLTVILGVEAVFYFAALVTPGFLTGDHEPITLGVIGRSVEDHPIGWLVGIGVAAVTAIVFSFRVENERTGYLLGFVGMLGLVADAVLGVVTMVRIGWFHWLTVAIEWLLAHTAPDTAGWAVAMLVALVTAFVAFLARHATRVAGMVTTVMVVIAVVLIIRLLVAAH